MPILSELSDTSVQASTVKTQKLADEITRHWAQLKNKRYWYEPLWQKTLDLLFSLERDIYLVNRHLVINNALYDGSGMAALRTFASGLVGNMTPRDQAWMTLRYRDPERNKLPGVSQWQKALEDVIYAMLDQGNFYEWTYEYVSEGGWACTACAFLSPDEASKTIRFVTVPTGTYWVDEDSNGEVDTCFREIYMEGREILRVWETSKGLTQYHRQMFKDRGFEEFKVLHAVRPRTPWDPNDSGNLNFPYESTYWLEDGMVCLEESGYRRFPFVVWRVERNLVGVWGRGPGFNILREMASLQRVAEDMLLHDQKLIDPAYEVPESRSPLDGREEPYVTHPGGINYMPLSDIGKSRPVAMATNTPVGVEREKDLRAKIENHFFVPFFLMQNQATKVMTIPEYMGRAAEQSVVLQPLANRFSSEVLDPLMKLIVQYANDFGILPKPPADVVQHLKNSEGTTGGGMDVNYVGPLSTLQKRSQTMSGVQAFIQTFGELKETMPENGPLIDDNVDVDEVVSLMAEANGVQVLLVDDATKKRNRQMRQQAQAMLAQEQAKAQQMQAVTAMRRQPNAPPAMGGPAAPKSGPAGMGGAF